MNKTTTNRNNRPKSSIISLKKSTLIIYLAIMLLLVAACGLLYGKILNMADPNSQSIVAENPEQSNEQSPNDGNETIVADDPIPAGNVDLEEEQKPTEDKEEITNVSKPIESETPPVKETIEKPETSKPDQVQKPTQEQKDSDKKTSDTSSETIKLPTTYVVQKGDTLSTISEKFYHSKDHYALLAEHNRILFINDMKAGDKLTIPALPSNSGSTGGKQQDSKDYSKVTLPATYLIQAGDTLSSISKMFYKSVSYVNFLAKENKLDSSEGLKAGSHLIIPSLKNDKEDEAEGTVETPNEFATTNHTVKSGETLYSISKTYYGSTKHAMFIADYNHIINVDDLKAGTVLKIPKV